MQMSMYCHHTADCTASDDYGVLYTILFAILYQYCLLVGVMSHLERSITNCDFIIHGTLSLHSRLLILKSKSMMMLIKLMKEKDIHIVFQLNVVNDVMHLQINNMNTYEGWEKGGGGG